jgi:hypothetical protein
MDLGFHEPFASFLGQRHRIPQSGKALVTPTAGGQRLRQ